MLLPIKSICPSGKERSDDTSIVFIQYCYNATQGTLLNMEIIIPTKFWNKKQLCISDQLPPEIGDYEKLNEELKRQFRIAEDLVTHAIKNKLTNKGAFLKKMFSPTLDTVAIAGQVERAVEQVIEEKKAKESFFE